MQYSFRGMLGIRDYCDQGIARNQAAERFDGAVRLMKAGKAPTVVLSGGPERGEGGLPNREAMEVGVPSEEVLVTKSTVSAEDETAALCQLVMVQHWT